MPRFAIIEYPGRGSQAADAMDEVFATYTAMSEAGITKVQLAKQLGVDEKEVRRLLDPHYGSKAAPYRTGHTVTRQALGNRVGSDEMISLALWRKGIGSRHLVR